MTSATLSMAGWASVIAKGGAMFSLMRLVKADKERKERELALCTWEDDGGPCHVQDADVRFVLGAEGYDLEHEHVGRVVNHTLVTDELKLLRKIVGHFLGHYDHDTLALLAEYEQRFSHLLSEAP